LGQAIHAFADFRIDVAVEDLIMELIKVHDVGWYHVERDADIFIVLEVAA
jgi:hypothetical protein